MKLNKANFSGLTSPGQQSEMKSILSGSWPPLKPLPVFKYETVEYRATIDFDKKRGEWVCRKTSLPSNEVQELRGGLRAITMALPQGEGEIFTAESEQQEPELEKDTNRRLQAIREWREKYGNGARYFELREHLSEGQRTELDDSLRLTLTARQLQFNSRNVADVFDDLSVAGGRFAALIEFADRDKANQGTAPQAQDERIGTVAEAAPYGVEPEAEPAADDDKQPLGVSSPEVEIVLTNAEPNNDDACVQSQEAEEQDGEAVEFPAVSIKNVFPEQEQPFLPERMAHAASQQFEIEDSEIVDADSASLVEPPRLVEPAHEKGPRIPAFTGFAAQFPGGQPLADRLAGSSSRVPTLKISAFQANLFALLFLFAVTSFTVGLTVGRGPLGKRLREPPQSLLITDAKPPTLPDQPEEDESSSRTLPAPVANSDDSAGAKRSVDATVSEEKAKEIAPSEAPVEVRSADANSSPALESKPSVKPEVGPAHSDAIEPVERSTPPPASPRLLRRSKVVSRAVRSTRSAPRSPTPYRLSSEVSSAELHMPRPSTVLAAVPDHGSLPFRVSFPNKTIAATSSLAMTSQLSVLVPPEPEPSVAHKSARLEAGELVSYVWPRYSEPKGHYGLAETIKVRATIGQFGQVQEVKLLSGSASLLPATVEAVRQWRYTPTLLDKRPVQTQQDVTIEFRPPQYSARVSSQRPSHN